jgi:hypothetical protein
MLLAICKTENQKTEENQEPGIPPCGLTMNNEITRFHRLTTVL